MLKTFPLVFIFAVIQGAWYDPLAKGSIEGYLTQNEIKEFLYDIGSEQGMKTLDLGKNAQGNEILGYYVESYQNNASAILITAGLKTTQPFAVTMGLYVFGSILKSNSEFWKFLRENFNVYFLPSINTEPWVQMAKDKKLQEYLKNLNGDCEENPGVDLDRNFGFKFQVNQSDSENDPCADEYQGTQYFSEKETKALKVVLDKKETFVVWLHFDSINDTFTIPWTYDEGQDDFGSDYLNEVYNEIKTDLQGNYSVGNSYQLSNSVYGGSLVDYGAYNQIFTVVASLEESKVEKSKLLETCQKHLEACQKVLEKSVRPLIVSYLSGDIQEKDSESNSNQTLIQSTLTFSISNPSPSSLNCELVLTIKEKNSNFTISELSSKTPSKSSTDEEVKTKSFSLNGNSSTTLELIYTLKNADLSASFTFSYMVRLEDSSLSLASSSEVEGDCPKSDPEADASLIWRNWYVSSSHHEGVAVGLVTLIFAILIILVILFIFLQYKKSPPGESGQHEYEEEYSSGYILKAFKDKEDLSMTSQNNGSKDSDKEKDKPNVSTSIHQNFMNSSIPLSNPSPKVEVKSQQMFKPSEISVNVKSDVEVQKGVGIFDKPKIGLNSEGNKNISVPLAPEVKPPVSELKEHPEVGFVSKAQPVKVEAEVKVNLHSSSRSSGSSSSDQVSGSSFTSELSGQIKESVPQVEEEKKMSVLGDSKLITGTYSFGQGINQAKVEEHVTFNSNSSSSSKSSLDDVEIEIIH